MTELTKSQPHAAPALIGVRFEPGGGIDRILGEVAQKLARGRFRVAGLIQTRGEVTAECSCREMRLHDLATGKVTIISEKRGPAARGCHLDWEALTGLARSLEEDLSPQTDVLIINRFGRSESEGRGFRGAIEKALELDVPVIVAFRAEYEDEWMAFQGGMAKPCAPDVDALVGEIEGPCAPVVDEKTA